MRSELSEIGRSLTEALPRRAVDSLEIEVKALAERIDHSRQTGVDGAALTGLENGLTEVREALRGLTTAESLVGVEDAVTALSRKVDVIATNHDPAALQQLEEAIGALRGILNHVASNDTLTKVAEDVRGLASRVDDVANMAASGDALSALENRIDTLTNALHASNEAGHAVPRELERLIAGLIEKLEWIQLTHTDHAALGHLEDRIATLMKRLDSSDSRLSHLDAIERGLADLLVHIEQTRGGGGAADGGAPRVAPVVDALKREVDEIKTGERRARDSIEAVHDTVEQVVDRLAMLESGIRGDAKTASTAISAPESRAGLKAHASAARSRWRSTPIPAAPSATNPAPAPTPMPPSAAAPAGPPKRPARARRSIRRCRPTIRWSPVRRPAGRAARHRPPTASRHPKPRSAIPSHRSFPIGGKSNFIAAARKAAQAAALAAPSPAAAPEVPPSALASLSKKLAGRLRTLIVAGSVVAIVVGGVHVVSRMFDDGTPSTAPAQNPPRRRKRKTSVGAGEAAKSTPAPVPSKPERGAAADATPDPGRQSLLQDFGAAWPGPDRRAADRQRQPGGRRSAKLCCAARHRFDPEFGAATGRIRAPDHARPCRRRQRPSAAQVPGDKLPATIGGPGLRAAAVNGDAGAAYEVAVRYAEGHGVAQNYEAAAHWFERAAKQGLAPAQFRLGGFYEKGIGVKKDLATARDLYVAAADKGNAKAMHNLAVLYAEGIDGKPDYRSAAQWFRKAADHGVADSQYNLGILYARGIGVETNLAEAYKWFALAASEGDKEAAKKRDDVGAQLDQQSLTAARTAVQTWTAAAQPEDAINVKMPAGGWDHPAGTRRAKAATERRQGDADQPARLIIRSKLRAGATSACAHGRIAGKIAGVLPRRPCRYRVAQRRTLRRRADTNTGIHVRAGRRRCLPTQTSIQTRPSASGSPRADLSSDRRPAGQHLPGPRHGARGRLHLRHVRHRRRLPDDAAADLHRRLAGGGGGERREPHRRLVVLRRDRYWRRSALDLALALMLLAGGIVGTAIGRLAVHACCARSTSSISRSACPT